MGKWLRDTRHWDWAENAKTLYDVSNSIAIMDSRSMYYSLHLKEREKRMAAIIWY